MKPLQLDGSAGGGQMLRTALSLAMVTGQPFRMTNIRGKRQKPGLMRQHLTCVKAACEISGGTADGAEIRSTELVFRAGKVREGSYQFAIGTAGSTSLLFQTLLPALLHADGPSTLRLEGGTHNPMAPPFDFLDRVFLPAIARAGARAELSLESVGFAPAGGGAITTTIHPCGKLAPMDLTARGEPTGTRIRVITRHLPLSIAGRMLDAALESFPCKDAAVENCEPGPGAGVSCHVESEFTGIREMTSAIGEHGVSAEKVGHRAAKLMLDFIGCGAPVGRHLADQLLLPMALAGEGRILAMSPDSHVPTNIAVIEKFLPVKFHVSDGGRGTKLIEVGAA
ncbi:RNA 3'-terminal phosphate cyclase [Luteolibacter flavescens]|uniref:RNA 3'-terminal phosphate cyclase n=1 Tax=Luteolibacter flavescens TaxID=1859460 RepID=A0ABT3FQ28_9BACT|nr:RNA 3'-terminal phosphate cyclase [Luteolibacter flavescens]MCW1885683.1 RNA 3'-terminal phosphate cyclase [Luteolibacter flavescens]